MKATFKHYTSPSGNINITGTSQVDVTNYATAQVVDADLVAGNIKKDVDILGVVGTFEGGGSLPSFMTKMDSGTFVKATLPEYGFYINHSLGVAPTGILVFASDLTDSEVAAGNLAMWSLYIADSTSVNAKKKAANMRYTNATTINLYNNNDTNQGINPDYIYADKFYVQYQSLLALVAGKTYNWIAWA